MASLSDLEPHRITVDEYHRMVEAAVFDEDDRLELLDGLIVEMSPQSPEHARVIAWLNNHIVRMLPPRLWINPQLPFTIRPASEPEPDLAVVDADTPRGEHPQTAHLVIEVANESLRRDRMIKGALYAAAGIPEYWIVNLADRCVEVYRDPVPTATSSRYATSLTFRSEQELACAAVPEIQIDLKRLLGA